MFTHPSAATSQRTLGLSILALTLLPACLGQAMAQALTLRPMPPGQDGRTRSEPVRIDRRPWMTNAQAEAEGGVGAVAFEHGALGVQLESGFRLTLKPRRGGLALAMRNTF